ncbi:DUF58 domain-containing protein [Alkalibacillus haloalkaliphilus]|uniref:Uncharacterized protein n=1 Tax=Alkalibacillus haloalkaliphilus TaxID=94136 RepID=A0A511W9N2_9BACI|nr:DUF58 domain-containing protein [Alkalibacillus haloalkaliphilus]GEN46793.1 hypothetical protein AHA02nite_25690 [Alkalibacillus haloalkaliphilus]
MKFQKYVQENKTFPVFVLVGTILLMAGLFIDFYSMHMLIFISIFLIILYGLGVFYERHIDDYLTFTFTEVPNRHYKGDEGYIEVEIEQKGILPLLNAEVVIEMDDVIEFKGGKTIARRYMTTFSKNFNLMFWEKRKIKIPYETKKRGVAKVQNIELVVPNIFGFSKVFMKARKRFNKEVIVYPNKTVVPNIDLMSPKNMGFHRATHSLFDEHTLPVGTRDYEQGDAFNKIHWKASAKEGALQTKVFEKASQISWCFLLNVRSEQGLSVAENVETLLEQIAYMTEYATKNQIPYRIFVNISALDQIPFIHQLEGEGHFHYRKTLELLARMKFLTFNTPYERVLHFVWKHESNPAYVIQVGSVTDRQMQYLKLIERKGSKLAFLNGGSLTTGPSEGKVKQSG